MMSVTWNLRESAKTSGDYRRGSDKDGDSLAYFFDGPGCMGAVVVSRRKEMPTVRGLRCSDMPEIGNADAFTVADIGGTFRLRRLLVAQLSHRR